MKKTGAVLLAIILVFGMLTGCSASSDLNHKSSDKVYVVATIFPEYDWVRNVIGENNNHVDLTLLLDNGSDLHSYQPSPKDIVLISTCDVFIYVGGESDAWVDDVLKNAANKDMIVINLLDVLGDAAKEEEVKEGMEEEEEEEEGEEEEIEYDEHVWLSLKNASYFVTAISDALGKADSAHKDLYEKNAASYIEKLNALDEAYGSAVSEATYDTLLFGDRFPFRYLIDDYGLDYYAAFVGCSAETEASFETIVFLSKKLNELSLPAVMAIDGSDEEIANTVIQNSASKDQKILTLDSMQSVSRKDVDAGETYLSVMEKNLDVLKEALNNGK